MVKEVLQIMDPRSPGVYCDCTTGTGGHTLAMLQACAPRGRVVGLDRDEEALEQASERLSRCDDPRWTLLQGSFDQLRQRLTEAGVQDCDGVLADLGLSTLQLDDPHRGFSFRFQGPLDMRMDRRSPGTALDVIRGSSTRELARILREYGEERHAERIARVVREGVRKGSIRDTHELARAVREASRQKRAGGVDGATRTFMALRIAVNQELAQLSGLLDSIMDVLAPGGVFVCLSYHSLEDRIVKHALRKLAREGAGRVLTTKPLTASGDEVRQNRRARSAKLRAFRREGEQEG